MKLLSNKLVLAASMGLFFTACQPEDTSYVIPTTYNFENVSYEGQQNRLDMMAEITTYMKTAHVSGASALDATKLKDMYADNTGNHFTDAALNTSTKQLKDKTLLSEQSNFDSYMDALAVVSQSTGMTSSDGQAGIGSNNAGSKSYLFNANGVELTQVIEKGLMGTCFYYQGASVYLGSGKMSVDNKIVTDGKGTAMEHHWDEAFGYFGASKDFPTTTTSTAEAVFWGKYCNKHEAVYPLNEKVMGAFLKGRAAISADDITTRDAQIIELRKQWELVVAASCIYYLNNAKDNLGNDDNAALHELSEIFGFITSLKGLTGTVTAVQVNTLLTDLFGNSNALLANNYNVDVNKIEAAKTALVGYFTDLAAVKDTL